ncbi:hypothetical protein JZ751_011026 [Albula glossodonta]|uniref:Uncharacterized protein n=1 Tax=Albula glossodonta TaxID=121402 RepID=A0A8T2P6T1_9TELE|nr:hypothetical protein JZ751_011026 [Albula glossodonta]
MSFCSDHLISSCIFEMQKAVGGAVWGTVWVGREMQPEYSLGGQQESSGLAGWMCQFCSCWRIRQPTAVIRAAPFPLPSSDSRKLTLHFGASSFTVWCMILEKLLAKGKRDQLLVIV